MKMNIDGLTEEELIDLNYRVVERLRLIRQVHAHKQMLEFRVEERVVFYIDGGQRIEGVLTKYNQKTVTVIEDSGRRWNVSPGLLHKFDLKESEKIIDLSAKKSIISADPA